MINNKAMMIPTNNWAMGLFISEGTGGPAAQADC